MINLKTGFIMKGGAIRGMFSCGVVNVFIINAVTEERQILNGYRLLLPCRWYQSLSLSMVMFYSMVVSRILSDIGIMEAVRYNRNLIILTQPRVTENVKVKYFRS